MTFEKDLNRMHKEVRLALDQARDLFGVDRVRSRFLGPKGKLTQIIKNLKGYEPQLRPIMGAKINTVKRDLEERIRERQKVLASKSVEEDEDLDVTLPVFDGLGGIHLFSQTKQKVFKYFECLGFAILEGPEIDTEWYCFDGLNTPAHHPARNEQDTFFLDPKYKSRNIRQKVSERFLLRTQTSTLQTRALLSQPLPLRFITCGRVFRRDVSDATHMPCFHQIEVIFVEKGITVVDIKALVQDFSRVFFGAEVQTRLRPSYFPFTEPSFEGDIYSPNLRKLSDQWIEMFGCGLVDPNVFLQCGVDPEEWSGYAFGFGLERMAMVQHGIDDIRLFYENDARFLRQFA